jgi:hypothetical protein
MDVPARVACSVGRVDSDALGQVGGIRRIVVPVELGYPGNNYRKQGPKPTTFSVSTLDSWHKQHMRGVVLDESVHVYAATRHLRMKRVGSCSMHKHLGGSVT